MYYELLSNKEKPMRAKELFFGAGAVAGGVYFISQARSVEPLSHVLFLAGVAMVCFGIVRMSRAHIPYR